MDFKPVKGFCAETLAKLRGELAGYLAKIIAPVILIVTLVLLGVFWGWATTKHSLEMYGWMWVAGVSIVGGLPSLIVRFVGKKRPHILYREDEEISVVLEHKLRTYERQKKNEILMDFRSCDRKWGLPKGSAKKLLPAVIEKDKTWRIKDLGGNAMTIIREDPRVTVLKHRNRQ